MNLEESIVLEGLEIFRTMKAERESIFNKDFWLGRIMDVVMKDQSFKVDLFRFVDVLPMLSTTDQLVKHMEEYLQRKDRDLPLVLSTALKTASLAKGIAAATIKKNVSDMAGRFIAGVDLSDAQSSLTQLIKRGFSFTIDLLGEKTLSDNEADHYQDRYRELIIALPAFFKKFSKDLSLDPPNISLKVSALSCHLNETDPQYAVDDLKKRVLPLMRLAKEHNVFVNFDVESFQSNEIVYKLFFDIANSDEFISWPHLGIVVQAYLKSSEHQLHALIDLCKKRRCPITIRLVKGAYWDYETVKAKLHSQDPPVFSFKHHTDENFENLAKLLLDNVKFLKPAFGSHNIRSLAAAIAYAQSKNIDKNNYEIQMLYGMAESERRALVERGHNVRIYVPLGQLLPGMSYLVRRLLENTSQMGFLKLSHHDNRDERALLKSPADITNSDANHPITGFVNASLADFTDEKERERFKDAIAAVRKLFPIKVPIVINGDEIHSAITFNKICPSDPNIIISSASLGSIDHAESALKASVAGFSRMRQEPVDIRVQHLLKLADILNADRYFLAAIISFEVGKTWAEADGDIAEAIDFCRYYAQRAMVELSPQPLGNLDGENNLLCFQGRGPSLIISPWNFPVAILCGMSVAAYVAGNPIIMKPSEQSILSAYLLHQRMLKAGFLDVQFLPGAGKDIGSYLVAHKDTANIAFTGSRKVGHEIMKRASTVVDGQVQMKRVICEMGGKNAIVVDDDADLDEAVHNVMLSAFGYSGQKCSAASRVIVIGSIKDAFVERLIGATKCLRVGKAMDPGTIMGPVIDKESFDRLWGVIENVKKDNTVTTHYVSESLAPGYFIPKTILEVLDDKHMMMQDELFGPIVTIFHARDLEHAITVANGTQYALTGAFFSRSPANIEYVREHFDVGNLYINQKCTGAMVARQPFGGFKMSGAGTKAGGPHYLLSLVDTKVITENTMRRGFTPEVSK